MVEVFLWHTGCSCVIPVRDITQCSVEYRGSCVILVRDITQCSVEFRVLLRDSGS